MRRRGDARGPGEGERRARRGDDGAIGRMLRQHPPHPHQLLARLRERSDRFGRRLHLARHELRAQPASSRNVAEHDGVDPLGGDGHEGEGVEQRELLLDAEATGERHPCPLHN
ncbi:hypothetical protein MIAR_05740 [Microbacterium arabinogalactanolyticum]|uniref:Uncharacterized protein n=1 Tax=Microbacterium arabinogalactanolyticum TaxID=69365 RepID=A0ABQ5NEX3_9MICO|nr:hypothetical protein MIAR_05740 [Microbacterium arabinogalactanolyticum]